MTEPRKPDPAAVPQSPAAPTTEKPTVPAAKKPTELGGPKGLDPVRYGDWERDGRCVDF